LRIKYLQWDEQNIEHIERHHISQNEVQEACKGKIWFRKGRDNRYIILGQTYSGRYLFLVLRPLGKGEFRPITARDMTESERRLFLRKVKQL